MPTLAKLYEEHSRPSAWQSGVAASARSENHHLLDRWSAGLARLVRLGRQRASRSPSYGGVASGARTSKLV